MILRLAPLARTDLVEIWRYSAAAWSPGQADDYLDALRDFLLRLAEIPLLGRPAGLQVDLYRFPHASHVSTTGSLTTRSRSSGCSINGWTRSVICRVAPARVNSATPGQLAQVELLLLGTAALVELYGQDQPDQGGRQDLPADGRDGEEPAPATEKERHSKEDQAQNQGGPGNLFGTFRRHCHWRSSSRW